MGTMRKSSEGSSIKCYCNICDRVTDSKWSNLKCANGIMVEKNVCVKYGKTLKHFEICAILVYSYLSNM